jgi:hypothetical protein
MTLTDEFHCIAQNIGYNLPDKADIPDKFGWQKIS